MHIQPAFNTGPSNSAQAISFPNSSGGSSPGGVEGVRADWNVRLNVSHETGFVGGAGRLLIHNHVVTEQRELTLLLPAAVQDKPGRLELASATVCSAKPGISAAAGQTLPYRTEGAKAVVTIPTLGLNDWVYVDLTWTGAFAEGGASFAGAQVPLGDFHPQLALLVTTDTGQSALHPVPSRYDVEVGSDVGATVRLEHSEQGGVVTRLSEDGSQTMHEFKSYGSARIEAFLAPAGIVDGVAMRPDFA